MKMLQCTKWFIKTRITKSLHQQLLLLTLKQKSTCRCDGQVYFWQYITIACFLNKQYNRSNQETSQKQLLIGSQKYSETGKTNKLNRNSKEGKSSQWSVQTRSIISVSRCESNWDHMRVKMTGLRRQETLTLRYYKKTLKFMNLKLNVS